ncbi:membrane protein [Microbacterium esteraromaticum]|uniref:Membrane protein n=1 Tax=Microbacterium esteraromaticum TaxID=57043 RepID=A0A1R4KKS9_9MICO|nr:SCO6880 family protein [Microbacterium esteraromaticum]SJN44693.1 membrane protein [Microbacterium esteraromaticum]
MSSRTQSRTDAELTPVKFSRLTRRGVLLGLSVSQLSTLSIGFGSIVWAFYAGGGILIAFAAPVVVLAAVLAWVPIARRPIVEWIPVAFWWMWKTTGGQLLYRRRIVAPRPVGTLALPGDMARLREYDDPATGAGMIHDPAAATLTVVLSVTHPAFVLLDPGEQERRVASWGRVLATACRSGRISMLQVLERTLPDSGTGLAEWWAAHGSRDDTWASTTYAELIDRAGPAGERHATTLSLSLDMRAAARQIRTAGGGVRGGAAVLRQEMATLVAALRSADLAPSAWLSSGQIAVILRSAYDPAVAASLERHGELGQSLATAGPVAVNESWSGLRTDSAHHAVLWISEWPRSMVYPGFLAPMLLSTGIQRSFSMLCTPMRSDQAARNIRKKKTEYISDAAQRQRIGQIEDASQTAEFNDVLQQEADLTAGHGVLRYTGLISVSAASADELDAAVAAIEQSAIQASCETRLLVGQQAQAFTAAALPLCRVV